MHLSPSVRIVPDLLLHLRQDRRELDLPREQLGLKTHPPLLIRFLLE